MTKTNEERATEIWFGYHLDNKVSKATRCMSNIEKALNEAERRGRESVEARLKEMSLSRWTAQEKAKQEGIKEERERCIKICKDIYENVLIQHCASSAKYIENEIRKSAEELGK